MLTTINSVKFQQGNTLMITVSVRTAKALRDSWIRRVTTQCASGLHSHRNKQNFVLNTLTEKLWMKVLDKTWSYLGGALELLKIVLYAICNLSLRNSSCYHFEQIRTNNNHSLHRLLSSQWRWLSNNYNQLGTCQPLKLTSVFLLACKCSYAHNASRDRCMFQWWARGYRVALHTAIQYVRLNGCWGVTDSRRVKKLLKNVCQMPASSGPWEFYLTMIWGNKMGDVPFLQIAAVNTVIFVSVYKMRILFDSALLMYLNVMYCFSAFE